MNKAAMAKQLVELATKLASGTPLEEQMRDLLKGPDTLSRVLTAIANVLQEQANEARGRNPDSESLASHRMRKLERFARELHDMARRVGASA